MANIWFAWKLNVFMTNNSIWDSGAEDYSIRDVFDHFKYLKKDPDLLFVFDLEEWH